MHKRPERVESPGTYVTLAFRLSALLIPQASAPYNAVGTITPSYRHLLAFIPNSLLLQTLFERLVLVRLGRFMEGRGVLPTTQFAYRKGLGTCDALLCVAH